MSGTENVIKRVRKRLCLYAFIFVGIGTICCGGIFNMVKKFLSGDYGSGWSVFGMFVLYAPVGIIFLVKFVTLFRAARAGAYVAATVESVKEEGYHDSDGRKIPVYNVYVKYAYQEKQYKNILWYSVEDRSLFGIKGWPFPSKRQVVTLLIHPKKPEKVLLGERIKK